MSDEFTGRAAPTGAARRREEEEADMSLGRLDGFNTNQVLLSAMKTAEANHRLIANNIANADTPHFSPAAMDFQKTLKAMVEGRSHTALRTSRSRHIDMASLHTSVDRKSYISKNDFNQVDLDLELAKLAENRGNYMVYSRLLAKKTQMTADMLDSLAR
jgi:flagellar basal-body rod protein FlgB